MMHVAIPPEGNAAINLETCTQAHSVVGDDNKARAWGAACSLCVTAVQIQACGLASLTSKRGVLCKGDALRCGVEEPTWK